jgi:hypothetical protein
MARGDLLRLTLSNLQEDGIHIQRHKTAGSTGKRTIYEWTPQLHSAVGDGESRATDSLALPVREPKRGRLHR